MFEIVPHPNIGDLVVINKDYLPHVWSLPRVDHDLEGVVLGYLNDGKSQRGAGGLPYGIKVWVVVNDRDFCIKVAYPFYQVKE